MSGEPRPRHDDADDGLFAAVRGIAFAARRIERSISPLSLAQLRILTLVARDPVRASALADGAALSRPTLTGILDGLVAKGWVERRAVAGDRRGVTLSITPSGHRALDEARHGATAAMAELLDDLPAERRDPVVGALGELLAVARRRLEQRTDGGTQ